LGRNRGHLWIGLRQANDSASGLWKWTDGTPTDFLRWQAGEPDKWRGIGHCAQVNRKGRPLEWHDVPCTHKMNGFICKKVKKQW
ncbi:lectin C-type domain protein, partial [Teladorsagia circumcincta]